MYALCIEVDVTSLDASAARRLPDEVLPDVRDMGSTGATWVHIDHDQAIATVLFASEEDARTAAGHYAVGQQMVAPTSGATIRSVKVGEVITQS